MTRNPPKLKSSFCDDCGSLLPPFRRRGRCAACSPASRRRGRYDLRKRLEEIDGGEADGWRIRACQFAASSHQSIGLASHYSCEGNPAATWRRTLRCNHPLCPVCARARGARLWARYGSALDPEGRATRKGKIPMATFTQGLLRDVTGEPTAEDATAAYRRFRRAWRRFLELPDKPVDGRADPNFLWRDALSLPDEFGGLLSVEWIPRPTGSWHVHGHALLDRYIKGWSLRGAWSIAQVDRRTKAGRLAARELLVLVAAGREATAARRDAHLGTERAADCACAPCEIERDVFDRWADRCKGAGVPSGVDVRGVHPAEGLKYATKAPHDPSSMSDEQLLQLVAAVRNARRVDAFGTVRGTPKPQPKPLACPACGAAAIERYDLDGEAHRNRGPPDWRVRELVAIQSEAWRIADAMPLYDRNSALGSAAIIRRLTTLNDSKEAGVSPFAACWDRAHAIEVAGL